MTPYIDTGFLACLLFKTPGTPIAWDIFRAFNAPFQLTLLHQLQIENLLLRARTKGTNAQKAVARDIGQLWENYLAEGIFALTNVDWNTAFRAAIAWNTQFSNNVPPPLLLLHPALAAALGATHFLSFDPRSRGIAEAAGLKILPERL